MKSKVQLMAQEVRRARNIKATLGIKTAAKYLANREWSIDAALFILLGK